MPDELILNCLKYKSNDECEQCKDSFTLHLNQCLQPTDDSNCIIKELVDVVLEDDSQENEESESNTSESNGNEYCYNRRYGRWVRIK